MPVRDGRGDVKQTTAGFRGPLMVQSLTSAKSKFLSLTWPGSDGTISPDSPWAFLAHTSLKVHCSLEQFTVS
jgi:hypothetical protein